MHYFIEPKQQLSDWIRFIQSNNSKLKMKKEKDGKTIFKKKGRPNLVSDISWKRYDWNTELR